MNFVAAFIYVVRSTTEEKNAFWSQLRAVKCRIPGVPAVLRCINIFTSKKHNKATHARILLRSGITV